MALLLVRMVASGQEDWFEDSARIRAMIASGVATKIDTAPVQSTPVHAAAMRVSETARMTSASLYERGPRTRR